MTDNKFKSQVQKYLTKWRRKLRLEDWRIKLVLVKENYATRHGESGVVYGSTEVNFELKSAIIKIAEPGTDVAAMCELEATVVHELLHLHFDLYPWGEDATRDRLMEQTVDCLALCLVKSDNPRWVDPRSNI